MQITYDQEADAIAVQLFAARGRSVSRPIAPGIVVDFDGKRLVAIEILSASTHYTARELAALTSPVTWLTLAEAAREAREEGAPISATTLRRLLNTDRLPGRKHGRDWQIARHDLWNYLEHRPSPGRPPRSVANGGRAQRPGRDVPRARSDRTRLAP